MNKPVRNYCVWANDNPVQETEMITRKEIQDFFQAEIPLFAERIYPVYHRLMHVWNGMKYPPTSRDIEGTCFHLMWSLLRSYEERPNEMYHMTRTGGICLEVIKWTDTSHECRISYQTNGH